MSVEEAPTKESSIAMENDTEAQDRYLQGWRLYTVILGLSLSLLLSALEIPIVGTSLIVISGSLQDFQNSSWVVLSYQLPYTGFLIIWGKCSDIIGRKPAICIALCWFTIFSGACGAVQSMHELVLQGIGGSGIYSMVMVILPELVPKKDFGPYSVLVSIIVACSYLVGPLLGGAINNNPQSWRWVFLLNVPSGLIALVLLVVVMPTNFPSMVGEPKPLSIVARLKHVLVKRREYRRLDVLGAISLLAAGILLVTALQEARYDYGWSSPLIIVLLIFSALSWGLFWLWSWQLSRRKNTLIESVFPWRLSKNRIYAGMIINTILLGPPFLVPAIDFPQRFQTVNHLSPLEAALRFLAYAVSMPFGSAVASVAMTKYRAPPYAVLLSGGVFLTVGSTFFSLLPIKEEITASTYGYQVLIGLGVGGNLAALVLLTPFVVSSTDLAVAMSAINQFRLVGGATGLAICANVMGNYVERRLNGILPPSAVRRVLESFSQISTVAVAQQEEARAIFGEGFNLEMRVLIGFCAAQIPASFLIWGASLAE